VASGGRPSASSRGWGSRLAQPPGDRRILIWDDRSNLMEAVLGSSRSAEAEEAAVEGAIATVDHSDIRGSTLGPVVIVVIRRELPRISAVGQGRSSPHRISEGPPFRAAPRPTLALLQRDLFLQFLLNDAEDLGCSTTLFGRLLLFLDLHADRPNEAEQLTTDGGGSFQGNAARRDYP
jgi:hypothetical protein